jgi:hypothetical protein
VHFPVQNPHGSRHELHLLEAELRLAQEDLELVRQFVLERKVKYKGEIFEAVEEIGMLPTGSKLPYQVQDIRRPVIRLENGRKVLTRIQPDNESSTMIFHIRPGWAEAREALLAGPDGRRRFEFFVCTAGFSDYAFEAWRFLDPKGRLIPRDQCEKASIVGLSFLLGYS